MNKWLKKQFIKFILGECKHFCCWCPYSFYCEQEFEETTWKELVNVYKRKITK